MQTDNTNPRRSFLRNSAIAAFSLGLSPLTAKTSTSVQNKANDTCDETTLDLYGQGPFYTANAPLLVDNQLASADEPGTRLILSGIARSLDCTSLIPNMLIDVWHANDAGAYDNTGFNLRGRTFTNEAGYYQIETILPGKYLNGASYRPRHIHFRLTPPGGPMRITQLYFEGDTDIPGDAAASVSSGNYNATERIIPIALNNDGKYEGTWDIFLNDGAVTNGPDLHLDAGMLYTASPNPFTSRVDFYYGVFRQARVSIQVFNLQGALVADLEETELQPDKYHSVWIPEANLPQGLYIAVLKVNDLQVHYLRLLRQ
jgi:protocatechuate 3,4-dioxygenase beta subunit